MLFVHSPANAPERWEYIQSNAAAWESIEAAASTYIFSGHLHEQVLYFKTRAGTIAPFHPISGSPVPVPSHRWWLAISVQWGNRATAIHRRGTRCWIPRVNK